MSMQWKRRLAMLLAGLLLFGTCALGEAPAPLEAPVAEAGEVLLGDREPMPAPTEEPADAPEGLEIEDEQTYDELPDEADTDAMDAADAARLAALEDRVIAVGQSVNLNIPVSGTQFKSSDKKIATVGETSGVLKGVKAGKATIALRVPGYGDYTFQVIVKNAPKKVALSASKLSLNVGDTAQLKTKLSPTDALTTLSFASSDSKVVTVDENGLVTAVGGGKATVTVRTHNGKTAKCSVTANVKVTGVTLDKAAANMLVNDKLTLKASILPAGATSKLTWKSSKTSVATVKDGKVTAKKAGNTTITVTTKGFSASCEITVTAAPTKVALNAASGTLYVGQSFTLKAAVSPSGTQTTLTWASSDTGVATVTDGVVTGVKAGKATIGVKTANGKTASCKVTVKEAPKVTIKVNKTTLRVGETAAAVASLSPVTWSVEGSAITVDSSGTITAVAAGDASVWATSEYGTVAGCVITVEAAEDPVPTGSGYIIDISKYQGSINFDKLKPYVSLVIARATCGTDVDTKFASYAKAMNSRGIPFGVYCYSKASTAEDAMAEAKKFYETAKGYKPKFYVLDAEYATLNQTSIAAFVWQLRQLGAKKVGCYIAHNHYNGFGYPGVKDQFDFTWIPRYGKNDGTIQNSTKPSYPCDMWQYTSTGSVPGISGNVDMNVLTGQGKALSWFVK